MNLSEKDKFLLGVAQRCVCWDEGADFEWNEVMEDWEEEIGKYYPIQYPGDDEEFAKRHGITENSSKEKDDTVYKLWDKEFTAWVKQYEQVRDDVLTLLNRLITT